ncbi:MULTISPECIES: hypothetical protein [Rahnella]|jgi:hypothetical protein|uniref:Uncharacterized protein n=2 Tax=Rahnella TaxID=34037 RepID=A0A6M2B6U0_9GAMM|nr:MULTISPECIES: hypothetical protein [Rahnella]KAB8308051.1 hypothetical protein EH227_15655 [Rouxiella chamberiensis]MBF7979965.1 hypothetical protein [Rahnella laticis]MBF7994081.1 hypothetical protein [Rahnella laticis]MBF8000055.1 hypothetical protein [Rahnella sp. LAC-M12]MBU9818423.1 hypothetical protein [Rahnella sp. BCC 1045]
MMNFESGTAFQQNSVTVFRSLVAGLDLGNFNEGQLYDLSALASESAEGLCQGLLCLSEGLENGELLPPEGILQVSAYLKASAHILPVLFELSEKASDKLGKVKKKITYPMM